MTEQNTEAAAEARSAHDILNDMEEPLLTIADLGEAVTMMASELMPPQSGAFAAVARSIVNLAKELADERDEASQVLHPSRGKSEAEQ